MEFDTDTDQTYPACLHGEIAALAREVCARRLELGEKGDAFSDWLEAEATVLAVHSQSPARLMPGGDLLPN